MYFIVVVKLYFNHGGVQVPEFSLQSSRSFGDMFKSCTSRVRHRLHTAKQYKYSAGS